MRAETRAVVDQPLCMVSQLPRSGGTLLIHLFDGHPSCHVVPHEFGGALLRAELSAEDSPEQTWEKLRLKRIEGFFRKGYSVTQRQNADSRRDRVPLLVATSLQKEIFLESYPEEFSVRAVIDAYFTSYFNAWIDNQNLYTPTPKKWVVCFEPRAIFSSKFRDCFDRIYPDGRVISVVREPASWYVSARNWSLDWHGVAPAMHEYTEKIQELLRIKEEWGERLAIVEFKDLVQQPADTMRGLHAWLGVPTPAEPPVPTVNGLPIGANSSFKIKDKGVVRDPLKRGRNHLAKAEQRQIEKLSGDLMQRVAERALRPATNTSKKKK